MLVRSAFRDWKKALEKFRDHQTRNYHKNAFEDAQNFKMIHENKKTDIIIEIDRGQKQLQHENRQKLVPVIRTVLLCGRQGLALRGHRDYGPLSLDIPLENDGNFRALLRFAVQSGDVALQRHLDKSSGNATYLSSRIQNEIIEAAGEVISKEIVKRVNDSRCFTITADETTDVSGIEQMTIGLRYVQKINKEHKIREDFLCFVPVNDFTGAGLASTLLNTLEKLGVNMLFMKGQGYDGALTMSGEFKGCAAIVKKSYPDALYVHCANHNLNLAITHACDIPSIRDCMATVKTVVNFFRKSKKAGDLLKKHILAADSGAKQIRLQKFCETRWVEHLTSLNIFYETLEYVCLALEEMDEKRVKADGVQPSGLLASIRSAQFIIALRVLTPIFSLTKNLSLSLQREDCDLSRCVSYANDIHQQIKEMRAKADEEFSEIFTSAANTAEVIGAEITIPRRVGRQKNRSNYEGGAEAFYRRSIFIPFLDKYSEELESRFLEHRELLTKIENIIPTKCTELNESSLFETVRAFEAEWPNDVLVFTEEFKAEIIMWQRHCSNISEEKRPKSFIESLDICDEPFYPTIYRFLQIGATLPVTVASSERSFSTLRRLKTYLRNKTGEQRLNGLALLNIHRDLEVNYDQILDIMAKKPRKIDITI